MWVDYKIETIEDQQKFIVPLNSITELLYYNQRMIIDNKVDVLRGAEPRTWQISKVNRLNSNGLVLVTLTQEQFNPHTDFIEYEDPEDPSTIVGMWADYFTNDGSTPTDETPIEDNVRSVITYVGKASIKVGGSYKKLTVTFYDGDEPVGFRLGQWAFAIDGVDASSLIQTDSTDIEQNQIKVKFTGSEDYMGKTLTVSYSSTTGIVSSVDILITGA